VLEVALEELLLEWEEPADAEEEEDADKVEVVVLLVVVGGVRVANDVLKCLTKTDSLRSSRACRSVSPLVSTNPLCKYNASACDCNAWSSLGEGGGGAKFDEWGMQCGARRCK
jgi:hypothetical protein